MKFREIKNKLRADRKNCLLVFATHYDTFQLELEMGEEREIVKDGKLQPSTFHSLEEVYEALRSVGVHEAYLVQTVPHDEMIGNDNEHPDMKQPERILLEF